MSMTLSETKDTFALIPQSMINEYCHKAWQAMLTEVNLSPKPGLVDRFNCGAHSDMTLEDFYRSAHAIHQWLPRFMEAGAASAEFAESNVLSHIRPIGLACENAMFDATAGVNTHKGTIFSLGLLLAAIGRLYQKRQPCSPEHICATVAAFCQGLTKRELEQSNHQQTAGQRLYQQLGLTGARGEAEAGYPLVTQLALPHYFAKRALGINSELALLDTLLLLIAHNGDTNVASRSGAEGLSWMQHHANELLIRGGIKQQSDLHFMSEFDKQCIARNISPGGSADLLIVTCFLADLPPPNSDPILYKTFMENSYVCFKR